MNSLNEIPLPSEIPLPPVKIADVSVKKVILDAPKQSFSKLNYPIIGKRIKLKKFSATFEQTENDTNKKTQDTPLNSNSTESQHTPKTSTVSNNGQENLSKNTDNGEKKRVRKSRWSNEPPAVLIPLPVQTPPINPSLIGANSTIPLPSGPNISLASYDNMSQDQKDQFEESRKMRALCSYLVAKARMQRQREQTGKFKYEYDSDEDTTEGTWEHKKRRLEMERTKEEADLLTQMGQGKHHIGDFLPPEELQRFLFTYHIMRQSELTGKTENELLDEFEKATANANPTTADDDQNIENMNSSFPQNGNGALESSNNEIIATESETQSNLMSMSALAMSAEEREYAEDCQNKNDHVSPCLINEDITTLTNNATNTTTNEIIDSPSSVIKPSPFAKQQNTINGLGANSSDFAANKLSFDNNIGYRILMKMGWDQEHGLGAQGQGIVDPINKARVLGDRVGLGVLTALGNQTAELRKGDDEYDAYRKRMMLAYRFRPNPLNNPRRAYY